MNNDYSLLCPTYMFWSLLCHTIVLCYFEVSRRIRYAQRSNL
jgi:hypothetical protein